MRIATNRFYNSLLNKRYAQNDKIFNNNYIQAYITATNYQPIKITIELLQTLSKLIAFNSSQDHASITVAIPSKEPVSVQGLIIFGTVFCLYKTVYS